MTKSDIRLREVVFAQDAQQVEAIVRSTGFFSADEIAIARELVEERLDKGAASGYHFLFALRADKVVGYTCFGPIPATQSSFDLYWIALRDEERGQGTGRLLNGKTEEIVLRMGGRRLYAETSGRSQYESTRAFYRRCGYTEAAVLEDFYAPGDAKIIYEKKLAAVD
ncbi:MAG: GNAT family N-acetyltransferase [Deltaproteobacteria bacterium]|nr:GNAT family N-acetyltransferase [Deltaproteobacteria bacterium]